MFSISCSLIPFLCFLFSASYSLLPVLCFLFYAFCSLLPVLCFLFSASCSLLPVLCFLFYASCSLLSVLCFFFRNKHFTCFLLKICATLLKRHFTVMIIVWRNKSSISENIDFFIHNKTNWNSFFKSICLFWTDVTFFLQQNLTTFV